MWIVGNTNIALKADEDCAPDLSCIHWRISVFFSASVFYSDP